MNVYAVFSFVVCAADIVAALDCSETSFTDNPVDTDKLFGSTAFLSCSVTNPSNYTINWYKDEYLLVPDSTGDGSVEGNPRYQLENHGVQYSLNIYNLTFEDGGVFKCKIDTCEITSGSATLTVIKTPETPYVTGMINDSITVVSGSLSEIVCHADNAKPAADVVWRDVSSSDQTYEVSNQDSNGLTNTTSTLALTFNITSNGDVYVCDVDNQALDMEDTTGPGTLSAEITLNVIVAPSGVFITSDLLQNGVITMDQGKTTTASCQAVDAKPQASITWQRNNQFIYTGFGNGSSTGPDELGLFNTTSTITIVADAAYNGAIYRCNAENEATTVPKTASFVLQVNEPLSTGVIIAIVLSSFFVLLLIIILIICLVKNRKDKSTDEEYITTTSAVPVAEIRRPENGDVTTSENTVVEPTVKVETEHVVGHQNTGYTPENNNNESTSEEETSDDETSSSEDEELSDDSESISSSVLPPGETFSISSSIQRSDRGSPVHINDVEYFDVIEHSLTSPMTSWMPSVESFDNPSIIRHVTDV